MELNKDTEIRHLPANIRETLAQLLENSWEILMEGIPKELAENNDVDFVNNFSKYSSDQINLVQKHCMVQKVNFPALVLFDEWGSSGKIRPTLGHLVKILSKLQLYRAADYLCNLLHERCPIRPSEGPAAEIFPDFSSFEEELSPQAISNYGDNRYNPNDNKGYSNQNKVQLPKGQQIVLIPQTFENLSTNRVPEADSIAIQPNDIIPEVQPFGDQMIPDFEILIPGSIASSTTKNETTNSELTSSETTDSIITNNETSNGNISAPMVTDSAGLLQPLPYPNLTELNPPQMPNLSAFYTSNSHDTNHNIMTNGYMEVENIKFFDIQSATDNFNDSRKLGEGGFSTVYLAINLRPSFKYSAIKRLYTNNAISSEHFFREIELLKNVEHQNLIKLLGYSSQSAEMCFVYEYINGGNLYEKLEKSRLDKDHLHWKDRINIARGCSEGIKYLHSSLINIIHRDIKSSNILLDGQTPKICDFGFVKNANFNRTTIAVGTNPYMAPETVRGNVSIAVDIFAFGVVILELVSGFNVLDDSKPNEIIDLVTHFETSLKQSDYHIEFTDKKAGDWKHSNYTKTAAEEMLEIARKCLLYKSDRLNILEVNLGLTKIYNDYCT